MVLGTFSRKVLMGPVGGGLIILHRNRLAGMGVDLDLIVFVTLMVCGELVSRGISSSNKRSTIKRRVRSRDIGILLAFLKSSYLRVIS